MTSVRIEWPAIECVLKLPKIQESIDNSTKEAEEVQEEQVQDCEKTQQFEDSVPKLSGRKRFSKVAFTVLKQVLDQTPENGSSEVEIIDMVNKQPVVQKDMKNEKPKTSKKSIRESNIRPDSRNGNNQKHKLLKRRTRSFASMVRLASLNKKHGGLSHHKQKNEIPKKEIQNDDNKEIEDIEEAEELDIPKTPRLSSQFSEAAQFAMLKCYEDLLLDSIQNENLKDNRVSELMRVKTPNETIEAVRIEPRPISRKTKRRDFLKPTPSTDDLNLSLNNSNGFIKEGEQNMKKELGESDDVLISAENTQLRLSYRFQTAMDILDNMKLTQGKITTTPRDRIDKIKQLGRGKVCTQYNAWSRNWSRDFRYELCTPKEQVSVNAI